MLVVAHRTPRTAAGCRALVTAGAGAFEVDVQLRRGALVVSHYLPFLRIHGWLEHDNARFRWRTGPPYDATLAEMLEVVPGDVAILLDPKLTGPGQRVELTAALAAALPVRDRFRVSTSDPDDLARYREAGFRTWRTIAGEDQLRTALREPRLLDEGVSVRHRLLDEVTVARLHQRVDTIVAWTVNDPARARALKHLGVDGVTTDRVAVVSAVTGQRR